MNVIYFIILIGALIFFHELGHFLAAKAFGVKVLKFALGFGRSLVSLRWGETTYAINLFPLGGYVKMAGQEPTELRPEEVPEDSVDAERAFDHKPRWQRMLIILAGPVFNLILPLPLFFFVFATEATLPPATIGSVIPEDPAWRAGLRPGDQIVAIDGEPVHYWEQLEKRINESPGRSLALTVVRHDARLQLEVTPTPTVQPNRIKAMTRTVGLIGVTPLFLGSQLGVLDPQSPAGKAGLQTWDIVVSAAGKPVRKWIELERLLAERAGSPLELIVRRTTPPAELAERPEQAALLGAELHLTLQVPPAGTAAAAGLAPGEFFVAKLDEGGAAARAGLQVGDLILAVDQEGCVTFDICLRHFKRDWEKPHTVSFLRPGVSPTPQQVTFKADIEKKLNEVKEEEVHARFGLANRSLLFPADPVPNGDRWSRAASTSAQQSWQLVELNALGLGLLATGQISTKSVGGPIMIFDLANKAARRGWEDFLWLMAVISINLGLINLLPIPVLDGGQIVFLGIEMVMRGPLSLKARIVSAYVGLTMIVLLMVFAFKNDIERYWDDLTGIFR